MLDLTYGLSGYPLPAFYFSVIVGKVPASFQEVSGLGAELDVDEVREGGDNTHVHQLPKPSKYQKLSLKRGLAPYGSPLEKWCKQVIEQDKYPIETRTVHVFLLNQYSIPVYAWICNNAYPVSWQVEGLSSTKNEVAVEKIELVCGSCQTTSIASAAIAAAMLLK